MKIKFELLILLCDLYKAIPMNTPKRLELIRDIASEISACGESICDRAVLIDIKAEESYFQNSPFVLDIENLSRIEQDLPRLKDITKNRLDIPLILIPDVLFCCGKKWNIVTAFAKIQVYSSKSILEGKSYHGKCTKCHKLVYYGYEERKGDSLRIFNEIDKEILLFNSGIAFTKELLKLVDNMICIGGISFEKVADCLLYTSDAADE